MSMKNGVMETGCGAAGGRDRLFVLRSSAFAHLRCRISCNDGKVIVNGHPQNYP
jgi:hypothetical protein